MPGAPTKLNFSVSGPITTAESTATNGPGGPLTSGKAGMMAAVSTATTVIRTRLPRTAKLQAGTVALPLVVCTAARVSRGTPRGYRRASVAVLLSGGVLQRPDSLVRADDAHRHFPAIGPPDGGTAGTRSRRWQFPDVTGQDSDLVVATDRGLPGTDLAHQLGGDANQASRGAAEGLLVTRQHLSGLVRRLAGGVNAARVGRNTARSA